MNPPPLQLPNFYVFEPRIGKPVLQSDTALGRLPKIGKFGKMRFPDPFCPLVRCKVCRCRQISIEIEFHFPIHLYNPRCVPLPRPFGYRCIYLWGKSKKATRTFVPYRLVPMLWIQKLILGPGMPCRGVCWTFLYVDKDATVAFLRECPIENKFVVFKFPVGYQIPLLVIPIF